MVVTERLRVIDGIKRFLFPRDCGVHGSRGSELPLDAAAAHWPNRKTFLSRLSVGTLTALSCLTGGCATVATSSDASPGMRTVRISVGPCFGFCPVYELTIDAKEAVTFDGLRNTAVLGRRSKRTEHGAFGRVATSLAPFLPIAHGEAAEACDARVSDLPQVEITWVDARATTTRLRHDRGCRSSRSDMLNRVLDGIPNEVGVSDWTQQMTRPGVRRG